MQEHTVELLVLLAKIKAVNIKLLILLLSLAGVISSHLGHIIVNLLLILLGDSWKVPSEP